MGGVACKEPPLSLRFAFATFPSLRGRKVGICSFEEPGERAMPEFRTIDVGELKLRVAIEGTGPLVLMVHGFPESWYSWRHQMWPIAEAGFTAAAIDVRGYGGSDKPPAVADYAMQHMVADVAGE